MGTLDSHSTNVVRKIKIVDLSGMSIAQMENQFNTNYGLKGWRIVQIVTISSKNYLIAEKES